MSKGSPAVEGPPGELLITSQDLQSRVNEMGRRIASDYQGKLPLLVCVLNGAAPFTNDLVGAIDSTIDVDHVTALSYGKGTESSGTVRLLRDVSLPLLGRDVVVVEDIVDSGLTVHFLLEHLGPLRPASLRVCSLLSKRKTRPYPVVIDYVGFEISDRFVFGYGLDWAGLYRELKGDMGIRLAESVSRVVLRQRPEPSVSARPRSRRAERHDGPVFNVKSGSCLI